MRVYVFSQFFPLSEISLQSKKPRFPPPSIRRSVPELPQQDRGSGADVFPPPPQRYSESGLVLGDHFLQTEFVVFLPLPAQRWHFALPYTISV